MVAIVDCGVGNLRSVQKALEKLGLEARITSSPAALKEAKGIILPGVGAFAAAMQALEATGMKEALLEAVAAGKPLLGICLGMQLLFTRSHEGGLNKGLALLPGEVLPLPPTVKIPHMGWNQLEFSRPHPLFAGVKNGSYFYFVHSYYAAPAEEETVLAYTSYGERFAAAVAKGNVYGVQFHPEKSSEAGLKILANFKELVESAAHPRN